jgi:hypothetical protein
VIAPNWGQDHLSLDAIVAYVDDELAEGPQLRATRHLAQCRECAAQVVAQGQARAALRTAECPSLPSSLLSSLRAIPQDTDLPGPPPGLAVTSDGQLVSVLRTERDKAIAPEEQAPLAGQPPAGTEGSHHVTRHATHLGEHDRRPHHRLRVGTGVAVSGLALGAIALGVPADVPSSVPDTAVPAASNGVLGSPVIGGAPGVVEAQLQLPTADRAGTTAGSSRLPALHELDAIPGSFYGPVP